MSDGGKFGWGKRGEEIHQNFKKENLKYSFIVFMTIERVVGLIGFNSTIDSYVYCYAMEKFNDFIQTDVFLRDADKIL